MRKTTAVLLAFLMFLGFALVALEGPFYRTYSPDKQYSVFAARHVYQSLIPAMPGGGSDSPARLFLYDEVNERVIARGSIRMMWMTPEIRWGEHSAYYVGENRPSITEPWILPRSIRTPGPNP